MFLLGSVPVRTGTAEEDVDAENKRAVGVDVGAGVGVVAVGGYGGRQDVASATS